MNVYLRHCVIFSPSLSVSMPPAMSTSTSISLSLYRFVALCLCTCLCIFMHVGTYVRTYTHTYAHIVYVCMHVHIHATTNIHLQGCTWNVRAGSIMSIIGSLFRPCCVLIMLQPRNLRPQQGPRFANCQVGFCLVLSREGECFECGVRRGLSFRFEEGYAFAGPVVAGSGCPASHARRQRR